VFIDAGWLDAAGFAAGFAAADANNFFSSTSDWWWWWSVEGIYVLRDGEAGGGGLTCVTVIVFGSRSLIYATLCRSNWRDVKASGGGGSGGRVGPTPLLAGGSGYHTQRK